MAASEIFHHFFFISLFLTTMVASKDNCPYSRCSNNDVQVQFPFSVACGPQERHGNPGFDLFCNEMNRTVLELGSSGEFLVRDISYPTQEVLLYDEHGCLPKRLLSLDLSGSPFRGLFFQKIVFFNCSANYSSLYLEPIGCLSTSSYSIFATSYVGHASYLSTACVSTWVAVPTLRPIDDINSDLHLIWDAPDCRECNARGGKCGLKNSKSNEIKCLNLPRRGLSKAVRYVLIIGITIPSLVCLILIACYVYRRFKSYGDNNNHHHHHHQSVLPQPTIFVVGLDESVIQSYPKTVLGESRRLVKPDDNTCPICLSEYQPRETLKTIPACKHCFHAACIDEWLRRNITCPLCRNSPMLLPRPT